MGCQEYLINHTRRQVYRIDNSGHLDIFREVALALKNNPTWSLDDEVALFINEFGSVSHAEYARLLLEDKYACNDPQGFLNEKELDEYLNAE